MSPLDWGKPNCIFSILKADSSGLRWGTVKYSGHACPECTQPYRHSQYDAIDQIEYCAPVTMSILDGIVMGPTHCAYNGCTSDLINARGGAFCPFHETQYGAQCCVRDCQLPKINKSSLSTASTRMAKISPKSQS